ncbi:MAG: DUF362 domain-containing protein [Verrucomicrobia bacterium]|nr:DUF362 domain-containing protein [Verrucomicrobiota bacterium]
MRPATVPANMMRIVCQESCNRICGPVPSWKGSAAWPLQDSFARAGGSRSPNAILPPCTGHRVRRTRSTSDLAAAAVSPAFRVARRLAVSLALLTMAAAVEAQLLPPPREPAEAEPALKSRVVIARDPKAVEFFKPQADRVAVLVERGILAFTNEKDAAAAWRQFAKPHDVVGIKINAGLGPVMSTRRPVVEAVVAGLRRAGVPAANIIIWDRSAEDLAAAGWEIHTEGEGPLCFATVPQAGWDDKVFFQVARPGSIIWGDLEFGQRQISERSYYSRIVTRRVTKLINIAVLTDNRHVGLAACMHSLSIGSVDNNRRFQTETLHYDAGIAEICARPPIRQKLVLNILDALIAQYAGGPAFRPDMAWTPGEIYFSQDPATLDALGLEAIEKHRREAKLPPVGERARYVLFAVRLGLGTDQRSRMDIVELNP